MRLTLRTLLAYLDNTLDSRDSDAIKLKLAESSFATQLVQRIRDSLHNANLAAPAPNAVGPIEDANSISEYLDSTLSAEQIAEIERACLESDPHLAEAAACHQILTMVLGKPANVSAELRKRIYELPEREIEQIATGENFSSLAVPVEPNIVDPDVNQSLRDSTPEVNAASIDQLGALADEVPTAEASLLHGSSSVEPVGVADSGVSDAPTRLRQIEGADESRSSPATIGSADPAIAGSKPRSITDTEIYGGSIRPSRITPWLVSLAVIGLFLFALSQIFAPLMSPSKKLADTGDGDLGDGDLIGETEIPAEQSPRLIDVTPQTGEPASVSDASVESLPLPAPTLETDQEDVEPKTNEATPGEPRTNKPGSGEPKAGEPSGESALSMIDSPAEVVTETPDRPTVVPTPQSPAELVDSSPEREAAETATMKDDDVPAPPLGASTVPPTDNLDAPTASDGAGQSEPQQVAKITSADALVAMLAGEKWIELRKGAPVNTDAVLVCAPTFQAELISNDNLRTTVLGPTKFQWQLNQETQPVLSIRNGRVLISPGEPQATVNLSLAGQPVQIEFSEASHVAAISVTHSRKPGLDPLIPENHTAVRSIIAVQGAISVMEIGNENTDPKRSVEVGQQWVMTGKNLPTVSEIEPMPSWVQPSDGTERSLEANARKGLMGLLADGDQTLEIALREATSFRQSEVAALAAQTLLELGKGDVYFDGVGILNQKKQRAYWPDHFLALQRVVDQGVESASELRDSIQRMDSANGESIMRLLAGYSQQQLTEGGDLELVEFLDSPSMAVRVLAIENLRRISDTTNYYPAEQENAVRREPYIRKWMVRQEKGTIRWPE